MYAFDIDNILISITKAAELIKSVEGVSGITARKLFSKDDSCVHLNFYYQSEAYVLYEPYGDSSEYWIGPKNKDVNIDISAIEKKFNEYEPPFFRKLLGKLLSFKF